MSQSCNNGLKNVQKSVMHVQSCCFTNINLSLFCPSRCRRHRCCLSSLLLSSQKWATMVTCRHSSPLYCKLFQVRFTDFCAQIVQINEHDATTSGIVWEDKRYLWLANGCLKYHRPIITNACPRKHSQKSLHPYLVLILPRVSEVVNCFSILGLQTRDKAAMLWVKTIELFLEEFTLK